MWMRLLLAGLLLLPLTAQAQLACGNWVTNVQGTALADVTVSSTAVAVLAAHGARCSALISNSSANSMRCLSSTDGDPTSTKGFLITGGQTLVLSTESRRAVKCIRTGGSDATASVAEALP